MEYLIQGWNPQITWNITGESSYLVFSDVEVRRYRYQMGFGTPVVYTVNDEYFKLG